MYLVGANYVLIPCRYRAGSVLYLVNKKVPIVLRKYQVSIEQRDRLVLTAGDAVKAYEATHEIDVDGPTRKKKHKKSKR